MTQTFAPQTGTYITITGRLKELALKPPDQTSKRVEVAFIESSQHAQSYITAIRNAGWEVVENAAFPSGVWARVQTLVFDGQPGTAAETLFLIDALRLNDESLHVERGPEVPNVITRKDPTLPFIVFAGL